MILPDKHTKLKSSLLGIGSVILKDLDSPRTISWLWDKHRTHTKSFKRFSLCLSWLYIIEAIHIENNLITKR